MHFLLVQPWFSSGNHQIITILCINTFWYPMNLQLGFYWTSNRIFQVCNKCLGIANFMEKCNKKIYWTSSIISIGHLLECTRRRPLEQKIWWIIPVIQLNQSLLVYENVHSYKYRIGSNSYKKTIIKRQK